jgi:uncharacterized membrane protein
MGRRLLSLWLFLFVAIQTKSAAAERTLVIERFNATIQVSVDGSISAEETIVPRFTGVWNGIYRTIPVEYRTPQGLNYTLRLQIESITDDVGQPLRYESSRERQYRKLKIYVPGATDTTRVVKLRYRVSNALRFFEEHDELYWNVSGDEWDVPIESASARVQLPEGVTGIRATAFRGAYGSTEQSSVSIEPDGVRVETSRGLGMREGLTIVVGWNPGIVHRPTAIERTAAVVYSNVPLAIPVIVFVGMLNLWRKRGRDPRLGPIVTLYEPPSQMAPAELGTLIDGRPDMRDITAGIVDLAVRGYVHIAETETERFFGLSSHTDYTFTVKGDRSTWSALRDHERHLLEALFEGSADSVRLSDLKNKFYRKLPGLRDDLYSGLVNGGFYGARPDRVRLLYIVIGVVIGGAIVYLGGWITGSLGMQALAAVVAGVASAAIIVLFGWFMPSRTPRGARELEKVLGFREFLSRVEGDRLERMIKTPEMFEKYLPYAMALGVEDSWAKTFDGIYTQPPSWYSGPGGVGMFRPSAFTHNLGVMSAAAASTMTSAPRSSGGSGFGGGSSGGGFGGGGGGGF